MVQPAYMVLVTLILCMSVVWIKLNIMFNPFNIVGMNIACLLVARFTSIIVNITPVTPTTYNMHKALN
jgi:hypothetical protein